MHSSDSEFIVRQDNAVYETDTPVLYSVAEGIATLTLNRPTFNNAQNSQMTAASAVRKITPFKSARFRLAGTRLIVAQDFSSHSQVCLFEGGLRALHVSGVKVETNLSLRLAHTSIAGKQQ